MYFSTHYECCEMPVYDKADGSAACIVYDASSHTWEVQRDEEDVIAYASCFKGIQLQDFTYQEWYVGHDNEFSLLPTLKLLAVATDSPHFALGQLVRIEGLKQATSLPPFL